MKSNRTYSFSQVPQIKKERSVFNRSHGHKTAFNSGTVVPVYVDEILPGDTMHLKMTCFGRLSNPLIQPIMDNLSMDVYFFFCPNRLVWENWEGLQGDRATDDIGHDDRFLTPVVGESGDMFHVTEDIADYFGLPVEVDIGGKVSALPFRAYNLIFNEWFRDENLVPKVYEAFDDGPDDFDGYKVQKRCKRHDYFTSCLLWPQKGDALRVSVGETAPVVVFGNGKAIGFKDGSESTGLYHNKVLDKLDSSTGAYGSNIHVTAAPDSGGTDDFTMGLTDDPTMSGIVGTANLAGALGASVNEWRMAFQLQRALEKDARGGTRYTEILRNQWGVISPDMRMQRPEYLGGGTVKIQINTVAQTSANGLKSTGDNSFQGNLAAFGNFSGRMGFHQSFTEHGWIIGLVSVRADLTYQQGIPRMFSRRTRWDFYLPVLAHLGEQEVLKKELVYTNTAEDDHVFGYQERWSEYRYHPSKITGMLRSGVTDSLDIWHLSQFFDDGHGAAECPALDQTFIEENVPLDRCLTIGSDTAPQIIFDSLFEIKHARELPVFSVPGMIDHF